MTGNVIILFNTSRFLNKQYELFTKHVPGQFIVVDNSTDTVVSSEVYKWCLEMNIRYIKTNFEEGDFSRSHAKACNRVYSMLHKDYEILGFFDHDLFPIKELDVKKLMENKVIAGVPQITSEIYLWAGLVIINNGLIDSNAVDFMPSLGKDTGGELSKIFSQLPESSYHLFAERPDERITRIYFDMEEKEPMFIHLRNGSNWAKEESFEERINEGLNILP